MKRKMLKVLIAVIVIVLVVLAGWYVLFVCFDKGPAFPFLPQKHVQLQGVEAMEVSQEPLMAVVESEEEAQSIAEMYDITFVSFEDGVALYRTDEDIFEVIARGQENGYPQLSINYIRTIDEQ